ncbi:nucleotide sugar dehydrogenase [Aureitalea marina]|uniref:UDP-N-acetyl-D-galactosamine dehydrogenase n=1 Tax=Aureitalea marina TaxID=930804 RepID=A0A2S7KMP3_9FLAO|nr:nucleotide sugar dehydrogenase [Aureitalea marina]PQB03868.1 UDP-N-acetyl-D-galactosamine dehydrogenase [Aureitalea marina]
MKENPQIVIIGLGYVGLPLAVAFAEKYRVIGFDINTARITELRQGKDHTLEVEEELLAAALMQDGESGLRFTSEPEELKGSDVFIITVPTPTDSQNKPVLTPLEKASETVGNILEPGQIVIYESTVYPGLTEEVCVPILEKESGLIFNKDFFAGYSPERINPGDKNHTIKKILKVTSGSTPEVARYIDGLYASVITAGTHLAPSIKVAEAAKVIENSQRDINIAFVNELAKIFNLLDIDTRAVLEAAGTKWNFLKFTPGLVGGHCIGVDPYYLAQKAESAGYNPEIILAGRRMNDSMGAHVASQVVKLMIQKEIPVKGAKALVLGVTFKENCPDIRNTRVVDVIAELKSYGLDVELYDPWAASEEVHEEYGLNLEEELKDDASYDVIVLCVAHNEFKSLNLELMSSSNSVIYDVKGILADDIVDGRL